MTPYWNGFRNSRSVCNNANGIVFISLWSFIGKREPKRCRSLSLNQGTRYAVVYPLIFNGAGGCLPWCLGQKVFCRQKGIVAGLLFFSHIRLHAFAISLTKTTYMIWLRPRKKLGRLFEQPSSLPPQATRPSTSGGPVAFRPLITQGLALSRETFCAQLLKNRVGTISFCEWFRSNMLIGL